MSKKTLDFSDLSARHQGVTNGIAAGYAEAARVCLDRHHGSPCEFRLKDNHEEGLADTQWTPSDPRTRDAWANQDDATEAGAYGLALAAMDAARALVAVRRAETRTGVDYYLGAAGSTVDDLEASFRLEVSGTDSGGEAVISARLRQKLEQASSVASNLPAIAIVVGFAALRIIMEDVEQA